MYKAVLLRDPARPGDAAAVPHPGDLRGAPGAGEGGGGVRVVQLEPPRRRPGETTAGKPGGETLRGNENAGYFVRASCLPKSEKRPPPTKISFLLFFFVLLSLSDLAFVGRTLTAAA